MTDSTRGPYAIRQSNIFSFWSLVSPFNSRFCRDTLTGRMYTLWNSNADLFQEGRKARKRSPTCAILWILKGSELETQGNSLSCKSICEHPAVAKRKFGRLAALIGRRSPTVFFYNFNINFLFLLLIRKKNNNLLQRQSFIYVYMYI